MSLLIKGSLFTLVYKFLSRSLSLSLSLSFYSDSIFLAYLLSSVMFRKYWVSITKGYFVSLILSSSLTLNIFYTSYFTSSNKSRSLSGTGFWYFKRYGFCNSGCCFSSAISTVYRIIRYGTLFLVGKQLQFYSIILTT